MAAVMKEDSINFFQPPEFKLFKQSSRRDSQFVRGERKLACRDGADLVCRWVLRAGERGMSV